MTQLSSPHSAGHAHAGPGRGGTVLRRRWRRTAGAGLSWGRALMALALAASVLVAGHGPAHGAAAEVEKPTRLAGIDRYETAVKIAEAYVAEVERDSSRSTVDTVILTSGLDAHFGYALPTPALARLHEAPVLLTKPDELPSVVTTFLTRPGIARVWIVGDASVVSAAVERDVNAISGVTASRVANVDTSYAAAVAIADLVGWSPGSPGEVRGKGRTALLATGENFADALAAGPLAYRGEHPILLTPKTALPAAVSTFLRSSLTEHVIILGGDAAVSADVENEVRRLGITVERWKGGDRFGTAIDIAEALLGFDTPQECFDDSGEVGLAYGWRSPDAIVSGPLLGELCAPLLLTERDALPSSVEKFLESDDWVTGDRDGKLRFTVFGGAAAVDTRAVDEAIEAAGLVALGATIEAFEGGCHFTVTFAEPVNRDDAVDITHYLSGNSPFESGTATVAAGDGTNTTKATVTLGNATLQTGATVPTGCGSPLRARDRIGIVGGEIRAAADNRRVGRVEYFVADDETPPTLTLNASQGSSKVWVESSEPLQATDNGNVEVMFTRPGSGLSDERVEIPLAAGVTKFEVAILPGGFAAGLNTGDAVSIAADEVRDLAGNANVVVRSVVVPDTTAPRVSQISVTSPQPVSPASVALNGSDGTNSEPAIAITSKTNSAADGVAGNDWTIDLDVRSSRPSSWLSTQTTSVQVSTANRSIVVIALSTSTSTATVLDVVNALNDNRTFNSLWLASVTGSRDTYKPVDAGGRVRFSGGKSSVDLTLEWTEAVRVGDPTSNCTQPTNNPVRVRLIEIDADGNGTTDFGLDGYTFGGSDVRFVDDPNGPAIAGRATCDTTSGVRPGTLVARIESASLGNLPSARSMAVIRSGAVTDLAGNANARQTGVRLENR